MAVLMAALITIILKAFTALTAFQLWQMFFTLLLTLMVMNINAQVNAVRKSTKNYEGRY